MSIGKAKYEKNLITTIRLSYIKQLIYPIIFLIIICYMLVKIPFSDIFTPTSVDELPDLKTVGTDSIKYYSISSDGWLYSGYNNYEGNKISEYIFYKLVDDECYFLLVSPKNVDSSDITILEQSINVRVSERSDAFNTFLTGFASDIQWNSDALKEASSPILLSTISYNTTLFKIILCVLLILFIYMSFLILNYTVLFIFPLLSNQLGYKHRHSADTINNRTEFLRLLQAELDDYILKADSLYITKNYIINLVLGEIRIIPIKKLCFIFEHGNLHKFLWVYMKVTHTMYFLCSNGLKCHFVHKHSGNIDYIMSVLKQMIPDLMIGYSTEHQNKYLEILKGKSS